MRKLAIVMCSALALAAVVGSRTAFAACIAGGQVDDIADCIAVDKGSSDCLLGFAVDFDGAGNPPLDPNKGTPTTKIVCEDGAACDRDGHINGRCTFHVGACVNAGGSCSAASLTAVEMKKPSDKDVAKKSFKDPQAVFTRRTLLTEIDGILGASEACTADDLEVVVPLKATKGECNSPVGQKCTSDQNCDDYCVLSYKKGKAVVKASVDDGASAKDGDSLKFFCLPAPPGPGQCTDVFQVAIAQGRVGDWMLRNSDVRVLVRDVGREHSFMVTFGGHILDADIVRDDPSEDRDNWLGMQALVQIANTQNTQSITVLNDGSDCSPGILRTSGPDDLFDTLSPDVAIFSAGSTLSVPADGVGIDLPLDLQTDYIIRPDRPYVQVATTFKNTSTSDLELFVGDYINAGGQLEDFGPGLGFGQPLLRLGTNKPPGQGLDYLAFQGVGDARGVSYGVVFPRSLATVGINKFVDGTFLTGAFTQSGVSAWVHRTNLVSVLNAQFTNKPAGPFLVPAMGENTLRRWFVVGETVADVTAVREELFGTKLGVIQGTVTSNGAPVEGAHVAFVRSDGNRCGFASGSNCVNVFSATLTDEFGFYRAFLPGNQEYNVQVRGPGFPYETGGNAPADHIVTLKPKKTAVVDVDLPATGGLRVLITDQNGSPIAGKVSVVGFEASPDPKNLDSIAGFIDAIGRYFGFEPSEKDTDVFGIAKAFFADHSGDTGTVNIEPGQYHVVVSHGPEYDVFDQAVTISPGATTTINATVNQVVDTSGFVSIDTHVHMINSPDSAVTREERIVSMLAEGVDFFVPTDHDHVHDLSDDIAAIGATGLVATAPSDEITTFSYGHFNVWPLAVDPNSIIGGALDWGRAGEPAGFGFVEHGSYDLLPAEIFGSFNPAAQVVQINHFNSGTLGHFNNLGIDTTLTPPESSSVVYRCSGGGRDTLPCEGQICLGGSNDLLPCTDDTDCPGGTCHIAGVGRDCPGGTCVLATDNLSSFIRLDPAVSNLYDDNYTALEVWIEASRAQTELALGDNLADWAGLLNQGRFKTGIADSDTHQRVPVQAGGPRTYVASATDDPALIDANVLAQNVNAGRAIGSGGLFMTVSLIGDGGAVASHALGDPLTVPATLGAGTVNIHVEAPTWAEFDTIEIYANAVPSCECEFTFFGVINRVCQVSPIATLTAGVDFVLNTTTGVSGFGQRLVADVARPLVISGDTWVIVVARGTDGVSRPLFPVNPKDLDKSANPTLAALTDGGASPPWNLGEDGQLAMAFSNPLFFDFENDGLCHGGAACP